jgi:nitrogen fixation/metabolism regulation signal transduction histidine kinase
MTRDLTDTVKALSEKAAIEAHKHWSRTKLSEVIAAVFEPAIRELIAEENEACAKLLYEQKSPYHDWGGESFNSAMQHAAQLIRARGGKA